MSDNSRLVVIGDIHGRSAWKNVIDKEFTDNTHVVFVGDYFDSFDVSATNQLYNFKEIVAFKEANPNQVTLLVGNHDLHYTRGFMQRYSGYQAASSFSFMLDLEDAIRQNLIQAALSWKGRVLVTHAGLTKTWARDMGIGPDLPLDQVADSINAIFKRSPRNFAFVSGGDLYGNDVYQGPCWVRPESLAADSYTHDMEALQVVGHTQLLEVKEFGWCLYGVDCLEYGYYASVDDDSLSVVNSHNL